MTDNPLKVSDLQFDILFETEPETGQLRFNHQRALLFHMETMGALRQQLIETLGQELAMGVLMRFGYAQGHRDAENLGQAFNWASQTDWLAAGPALHTLEGIVRVEAQKIEFDHTTGHFHMLGNWYDSYEATEHIRRFGLAEEAVCWTLVGYASGYASRFFGRELLALETQCIGRGDDHCQFEIRPVEKWGDEAEPYLRALEQVDISGQLFTINAQLQEQARRLTLLNEMAIALSAARNPKEVCQIATTKTNQLFQSDQVVIALLDDIGSRFDLFISHGLECRLAPTGHLPVEGTALGQVVQENRPLILSDFQAADFADIPPLAEEGLRSGLIAPLFSRDSILGALSISSCQPAAYDSRDQEMALQIASRLATTIENRRLLEQAEQSHKLLRSVIDATPDWIFVKDQEHRYRLVNQGYADDMNIEPEAFIGRNDLELGFPEEVVKGDPEQGIQGFWEEDHQVLDTGERLVNEFNPVLVDDELRIMHTIKAPLGDEAGNIWGVLDFSRDITEQNILLKQVQTRAAELETVAEISNLISTIRDIDRMLSRVADLTKEQFNLYHAHIYLLEGDTLRLTAGAGQVGRQMVAEGWQIPLDREQSLVAQAARNAQGVIVNDVRQDPNFMPNPLLPHTRSEMAVPMIFGDQVIGVLDVQAEIVDRFTDEDVQIQTILAGQAAVALQNARLYTQTQTALTQAEQQYAASQAITFAQDEAELMQIVVQHLDHTDLDRIVIALLTGLHLAEVKGVWDRLGRAEKFLGNRFSPRQIPIIQELGPADTIIVEDFAATTAVDEQTRLTFQQLGVKSAAILPLTTGQQILGWVLLETTEATRSFTEEELRPVKALVGQAATVLESQRLLRETENRAQREQILREVTAQVRGSVDIDAIMRTAAQEVGQALGRPAFIHLGNGEGESKETDHES